MKQTWSKITSIAAIALWMTGSAMAQGNIPVTELVLRVKPPIYFGITSGYSSVSGNFASTDYSNSKAGFASSGFNTGITGVYMLNKHFGITALASYHRYGTAGLQQLATGYKEDFGIDSSTVYTTGSNYTINLLAGPYYTIPVNAKLSVDMRLLAGLTNAHLAGNKVDVEDNESSSFEQKAAADNTLGLQGGIAARYTFCRHFAVSLNADYYYAKPNFTVENVNRRNNAGRLIDNYNQPISGMNVNLSLFYILTRYKS